MASKRHKKNLELLETGKLYSLNEAFELLQKFEGPKFDETINLAMRLSVDTSKADQQVRGATVLPHGVGKKVRILVFAKGDKGQEAEACGADFVGGDDLVTKIQGGWLEFDKVIATPDMMATIAKIARVLGPRGLMPNPKLGTVTVNLKKAIDEEKKGKVEFRAEKAGIVHAPLGKKSFGKDKLLDNLSAIVASVMRLKPSSSKGAYLRSVTISGAMTPGISLELNQLGNLSKAEA